MGQFTQARPFPIGKNAQCEISLLYKIYNSIKMEAFLLFTVSPKPKA